MALLRTETTPEGQFYANQGFDTLNNLVRLGAMAEAVDFSIVADTPSKPVDLAGFRLCSRSVTCSSVHKMDTGQLLGSSGASSLRGGEE